MNSYNVIIAEDNEHIAELICKLCMQNGLHVLEIVSSGGSLVSSCINNPPDIIVLDISLVGLDGITAVELLYQKGIRPKIIVVSGTHDMKIVVATLNKLEAAFFVSKPIYVPEFKKAIERVISLLTQNTETNEKKITLRVKGLHETLVLAEKDILFIKREINYSKVVLVNGEYKEVTSKLEEIEAQSDLLLSPYQSYLVNKNYIEDYKKEFFKTRGYYLVLKNSLEKIPLSRQKLKMIKSEVKV
ncbi:LytR/AlgR family response regulator transcription factor [Paenibacillus oryzisoli]|uniref:Response regulatory domain-containing protein n=1 Tax=Paenibacillus oryzisoli TaxID=1850517 RepID=A0A198A3H5_9BACL|nr:response regulator transcription factor [Paenibacillus oryzisoli]OAS16034.1 hypothetical protein A8708_05500 [Paenibacillus oryzisoli]